MGEEQDYITLSPGIRHGEYLVCVMRWYKSGDEFVQSRVSHPLTKVAAEALAKSWAAAMRLEVR